MNRDAKKLHELRESEGTCYLASSWELDGVCKMVQLETGEAKGLN